MLLRVHAKLTSQIGCDGVVPSRENSAGFESERRDELAIRFETSGILLSVQICGHNEAGFSAGIADETEHLFIAGQWLGSPAFRNLGEQTVLDGIPFGSASRVVSDGSCDAKRIAQLSLDFGLPGPSTATVAAARVRQNQKFVSIAMATRSLAFPPSGDGVGGKGRGVVRDADADRAAVVRRVVSGTVSKLGAGDTALRCFRRQT